MTRSSVDTTLAVVPAGQGVRLLAVPSCAWCTQLLVDAAGQSSWDLFGHELTYVCRGGCAPHPARASLLPMRRRFVRVAA